MWKLPCDVQTKEPKATKQYLHHTKFYKSLFSFSQERGCESFYMFLTKIGKKFLWKMIHVHVIMDTMTDYFILGNVQGGFEISGGGGGGAPLGLWFGADSFLNKGGNKQPDTQRPKAKFFVPTPLCLKMLLRNTENLYYTKEKKRRSYKT